ncbi:ComF family protein [Amycolatopsis sp. H20-H5]|uniref:ComF family protein n=1 Tax=Amycolatopsis sp. H20-H5 TaxID=3046309 RepID=UPI002DB781B2|nr:ComF family protein [Amycolatopsis sp. H20-H5]MEC3980677.1 ComF family protein [Amycolatopsis sp. H20-H5]
MIPGLRYALDLLVPARCAACGVTGLPCCADCDQVWGGLSEVARGPTDGLVPVYALARYEGTARRLTLAYKERGRRDLAVPLGRAVAGALPQLPGHAGDGWWLVPAPSRRRASRGRGGPHVEALAVECAKTLAARGIPAAVAPALSLSAGTKDAVGLSRRERAANLEGGLRWEPRGRPPPGAPVVVLDDVVTTGATAAACTRVLRENGVTVTAMLALVAAG